ncbi:DUF5345 family protein [Peribacillus simplex]|uniref:DUF5345 family protein n=1 Tax=Peribacillus simplex TaxID=1478 RepID=UPI003B8C47C0
MKNHPIYPNHSGNDDQETIIQINRSLENFDDAFTVDIPKGAYFEQKVKMQREKLKKKWLKELFIFTVTAAVILGFLVIALFHQPEVFLTIQVMTVIFIGFYTFYVKRKVSHE